MNFDLVREQITHDFPVRQPKVRMTPLQQKAVMLVSTSSKPMRMRPLAEAEVLGILSDGKVWKTSYIAKHSRYAHRNVDPALKNLCEAGLIERVKRGSYQKTDKN